MIELLSQFGGYSYLGIFLVLVLTGIGLPIPEELVVVFAGMGSANGFLNPWLSFAACISGALLGDCLLYGVGHHFGRSVLDDHPWFARFLKPAREHRMEELIDQHGLKVFLLARFLVGVRSPVYVAAGVLRVPFRRFLLVDVVCAFTVIGTFFGLSYVFADRIQSWWQWIRQAELALSLSVVVAVAGGGLYLWWRHRQRCKTAELSGVVQPSTGAVAHTIESTHTAGSKKSVA